MAISTASRAASSTSSKISTRESTSPGPGRAKHRRATGLARSKPRSAIRDPKSPRRAARKQLTQSRIPERARGSGGGQPHLPLRNWIVDLRVRPRMDQEQHGDRRQSRARPVIAQGGRHTVGQDCRPGGCASAGRSVGGVACRPVPGSLSATLELPDGTGYERSLYAHRIPDAIISATREYLLNDHSVCHRADLDTGAVAMSANFAFEPAAPRARMTELAIYALTQTRKILSDALLMGCLTRSSTIRCSGFWCPPGLARSPRNSQTFQTVTNNLRRIVELYHPDVQALWLARKDRGDVTTLQLQTTPCYARAETSLPRRACRIPMLFQRSLTWTRSRPRPG